ncbi:MAG: Ig-like domain-containing protein [Cyclobacteriaceae bacterium]
MKQLIPILIIVVILELTLQQCANPLRPTGGPKDTIPPTLLLSDPVDQTINYKGKEMRFYFDEFINADKLRQKLIITPYTEIKYKHIIKKRDLILRFEEPFADSTTYTFNFFDGLTDITERNPAENFILAFSTGSYIDSLRVIGSVRDLYTDKPIKKATVGLYEITDTLDIFQEKPYYFVTSSENGSFEIKNIKYGKYMLLAFSDDNNNLKLDEASEAYAFKRDTIQPSTDPDSIRLYQYQLDASQLNFISARPSGKYFDARYSKEILKYTATPLDSLSIIYHALSAEKDAIKFYPEETIQSTDSIGVILNSSDTIKNTSTDTVYVKFRESSRKPVAFNTKLTPQQGSHIDFNTRYRFISNKPILLIDTSSLTYSFDTLYKYPLPIKNVSFNHNRTEVSFQSEMDQKTYQDTLEAMLARYLPDTSNIDSARLLIYRNLSTIPKDKVLLNFKKGTIISVDYDSIKNTTQMYKYITPENYGVITVLINTEHTSYTVQLIDKGGNVSAQARNCTTCKFNTIKPGSYSVRILLDENQNRKWDIGNIRKYVEPEPIIHFPEQSELRANWTLELEYTF